MRELVIVGGGLAGCALAISLARRGRDVVLLERDSFPRDKLCGEFLSPESRRLFAELGLAETIERLGPERIHTARFSAPSGRSTTVALPAEGRGLSRLKLDALLFAAAREQGAETLERATAVAVHADETGSPPAGLSGPARISVLVRRDGDRELVVPSSIAVCAHGRRGAIDRHLEREFLASRPSFVGLKRHHRVSSGDAGRRVEAELRGHVEIHVFEGGYCGVSFVEDGIVNVCTLLDARKVREIGGNDWDRIRAHLASSNLALGRRLDGLEPDRSELLAVADVEFHPRDVTNESLFFIGDAAGMIPPLCGDGQAMALESGCRLAELLVDLPRAPSLDDVALCRKAWRRLWRQRFARRMRVGRWTQRSLLAGRAPSELAVRTVERFPSLGRLLARWTRGA